MRKRSARHIVGAQKMPPLILNLCSGKRSGSLLREAPIPSSTPSISRGCLGPLQLSTMQEQPAVPGSGCMASPDPSPFTPGPEGTPVSAGASVSPS